MPSSISYDVETVPGIRIPMRDGVQLAATLYRPRDGGPRPCLVNYNPYHKDGRVGLWYEPLHRFFATRGFAALVVDFRGLGCSEGTNNIPFDTQEGRDGHDAVEWAAEQRWCDGNVGMWGTSYGGITSLKTAAERPPHLKAIVPIHATTDNFRNFLTVGGCLNGFWANGDWGPRMVGCNLTPPLESDHDGSLDRLWTERLKDARPWCLEWYDATDEAARWAERAIAVEQVTAATFAVCGWKDFYAQDTLDYFHRLGGPKKLLMGPWKHIFPNLSPVEPVNLLELMLQWWNRWLRNEKNEAETGPPITMFVQGAGVWRREEVWPPRRNESRELFLLPNRVLGEEPPDQSGESEAYRYDPTVGLDSLGFDPWTAGVVDPGDHNGDDARSLCFTSEPLSEDWELTGRAQAVLRAKASVPGFQYAAKLCDVDPGGHSRLVTMGWCPDAVSDSRESHDVKVSLQSTSHVFRRGHRLRLSVALADFPRIWPTPLTGEIRLEYDRERPPRLLLPRTPPQDPPLNSIEFPPLEPTPCSSSELAVSAEWECGRELIRQAATLKHRGRHRYRLTTGGAITCTHEYTARVEAADPAGAAIDVVSNVLVERRSGTILVKTTSHVTPQSVSIQAEIVRDGEVIFQRNWNCQRSPAVS